MKQYLKTYRIELVFLSGFIFAYVLLAASAFQGCTTSQSTIAYQTISVTEAGVIAANGGFLDSVVTGKTPTNSVPKVEADFNALQLALHTAATLASGGASAPTPPALFVQATTFSNTVNSATSK